MDPNQRFSIYSHLFGLLLAVVGQVMLLVMASSRMDTITAARVVAFGISSIALYAASVACHSVSGESQRCWQRIDHAATFILIAGSYTPFALAAPRASPSLLALTLVWGVAGIASLRQLRNTDSTPPALAGYVGLGWFSVLAALPVAARAGLSAMTCLLGGALLYSVGTVFYRNRSDWKHAHGVWHLFVVGGTTLNAGAIYFLLESTA